MSEVIPAFFGQQFHDDIFTSIKYNGIKRTEKAMIDQGLHPAFVKATIRRIIRNRGW